MRYPRLKRPYPILRDRWFTVLMALALILPSGMTRASDDERRFEAAKRYTVKVRTRVKLPFYGDKKGTHTGAGFLVDAERGWIVTNAHVASHSPSQVRVAFLGGKYLPATKLYVDPYVDFAVLEISKAHRPAAPDTATLDCDPMPAVGHPVGAFGHPWDLSFTGTRGIISGHTAKYSGMLEMLQTDAPINPGNSGGPLISLETGKVVGINTATRKRSQNTNFAVPMGQACRILELLRAGEDPSPPDFSVAFLKDVDETNRLVVARIYEKNNNLRLHEGDVVRGVDGVPGEIENRGQLIHMLRGRLQNAGLRIGRGDDELVVRGGLKPATPPTKTQGLYTSGVLIGPTPWRDFQELVGGKLGLMVHYVERGSSGDAQRIETMDLLYSIDGQYVNDIKTLYRHMRQAHQDDREVMLKFIRIGDLDDNLFSYVERPLSVGEIKRVGWNKD
jgi:serine protease Do